MEKTRLACLLESLLRIKVITTADIRLFFDFALYLFYIVKFSEKNDPGVICINHRKQIFQTYFYHIKRLRE
ncbi:hypothetical protein DV713_16075 [Parageobacillus thermoglucosidasius]|nr:hypothetical protein DV714_15660 [Parageobacillus thermoglucosidasius]RDE31519.1 hypothetical protein DV713_16075 [Parageobacillus thermoglucosidasius]